MSIAFERVSYSYLDTGHEKRRGFRSRKKGSPTTEKSTPSLETYGDPQWGTQPDARWAIEGIDFELADGEFLGIAGHTGSGKSTLIQHMNGLLHPTRGRVLLDGRDLADKQALQDCRGQVGLVFQYPEHQLFAATVLDDVAFGPRNMDVSESAIDSRVRNALASVGLDADDIGERSPFELSGGQQRRVAFAGILAMEPQILVLDEPVAGLDPVAREEFLSLIADLHESGLTIAMVSHSMDDLARLADRILVLNAGRQFMVGTPAEVFSHADELRSIGLGVPAAQGLANELREAGLDLETELYDAEKLADTLARQYHAMTAGKRGEHA